MNKLFFVIVFISTFASSVKGTNIKTTFLGNYKNHFESQNGIVIKVDNAWLQISAYTDEIFRVRISKDSIITDFSYAVIQKPTNGLLITQNNSAELVLSTKNAKLVIEKTPIRLLFYTANGKLLNSDYADLRTFWQGNEIVCTKTMAASENFFGLGQKGTDVNRRGLSFINLNKEAARYHYTSNPLYSSFPIFASVVDSFTYGIFLDNSHKTEFNMGASTDEQYYSFMAENGELDYYFFTSQGLNKIIEKYSWLTGTMKMPPLWMLGNQQSRWSYYPDTMVLRIAQTFRERKIPADAIYIDIDYMDKFKVFTWSAKNFPNPKATMDKLKAMNFHAITIVDPGVKIDSGYFVYEEMKKNDLFLKYPTGKKYTGVVWPGRCHFPDFTLPKTRELWGNYHSKLIDNGIEGFWNDMNEPSAWGNSVPDFIECNFDGNPASFKKGRNVYAFQMARATFDGTRKLLKGNRTFILSRSGYSGIQRYAAMWCGDTPSDDDHMFMVVRQMLSMGVSGMPYIGFDTPGFSENPTGNQYLRWLNIAAYSPMLRNHHAIGTNHTEPWAYGEGIEGGARRIIEQRYKLLPYIYSTFYAASQTSRPICRMLPLDYTSDSEVFKSEYQHQYMFGDNLLVAPVKSDQMFAKVYLPKGNWYRLGTNELYVGSKAVIVEAPSDNIPVFVKESGILVQQSLVQSTNQMPTDTLVLYIYNGNISNTFNYYEDDGKTYQYENGDYYKRSIMFDPLASLVNITGVEGTFKSKFKNVKLVFCCFKPIESVSVLGATIKVMNNHKMHEQILNFSFADNKIEIKLKYIKK